MAARLKLAAQSRSPQRQALAEALARRNSLDAQLTALLKAKEQAWRNVLAAERAIAAAEANIETAKIAAAKHITDAALGRAGPAPISMRDARAAVQDAKDEHEARVAACDGLKAQIEKVEQSRSLLNLAVDDALRAVIANDPVVHGLLQRWAALQRESADVRAALHSLSGLLPKEASGWDAIRNYPDLHLEAQWAAALNALRADPDAPLPL